MSTPTFNITGDGPARYERYVAPVMASFVARAVERAELHEGASVLDVACGTGFVGRRASEFVGAAGRVAGVDLSAPMLEMARRVSEGSLVPFEWVEASALDLPFDDGEFDAAICQQGVQFFPDRARAIAEMGRVTRSGGHVVATFFTPLAEQPYFGAQLDQFDRLLGSPVLAHAFACDPAEIASEFVAAGLRDVETERFEGTLDAPAPLGEFVWGHALSLPAAPALMQLEPAQQESFVAAMLEALAPFTRADGTAGVPVRTYIVTGRR